MEGSLGSTLTPPHEPGRPAPGPGAVRAHLDRVLASNAFAHAPIQRRFLRFVVEETLEGRGALLKEYVVGTEVLGRGAEFDPKDDSSVRVAARRLRQRLAEHYAGDGRDDPIRISLHAGSYQPEFEWAPQPQVVAPPIFH